MAIFVDTGAWFACFVRRDSDHPAALEWMRGNRQPLVTTDFVFDELVTLLALSESRARCLLLSTQSERPTSCT
jgi:predicted nucleic acid-binding protein